MMSGSSSHHPTPSSGCHGFVCASMSHVGHVRRRNEDSIWVDEDKGWLLLADGMGGYQGGDVAAALAIATVLAQLQGYQSRSEDSVEDRAAVLLEGFLRANDAIRITGARQADLQGMGSTMVAAWIVSPMIVYAHIGDSRLYRVRAGVLDQLTVDHTVLQEQIDAGIMDAEEANALPYRGLLTRGLGITETVQADVGVVRADEGDRYLLCSDGLTDMLDDAEICAALSAESPPAAIASRLVEMALERGGRDNVSVIVARFAG